MHNVLIKLKYFFNVSLFPFHYCKLCGCLNGKIICTDCYSNLAIKASDSDTPVPVSSSTRSTLIVYAGFEYVNPLSKMLKCYKYNQQKHLQWALGYLLHQQIIRVQQNNKIDYIVPVPVHKKRKNERGYNHILLMLDYYIATDGTIPVRNDIVVKTVYHQAQMLLNKEQRSENLIGTFKVVQDVSDKNILIIDDVYTTGATVNEVSRVLHEAGAKNIYACVLLRKV